jgi:hypothetical protein
MLQIQSGKFAVKDTFNCYDYLSSFS